MMMAIANDNDGDDNGYGNVFDYGCYGQWHW